MTIGRGPYDGDPQLGLCVGRRGAGKTYTARELTMAWRRARREGDPRITLAIDCVATDPPAEKHLASSADVWAPAMPDELPPEVDLIVVDEADLFAPQADARKLPPPPLVDLVRRGRHRGVSLVLCTQRPALVMRDAYALADWVVICQTTDRRDLDRLCELEGVEDHRDRIKGATRPGPVLIWYPPPRGVKLLQP